jgi:lipopolysaccharide/colanic/teichoic acid biosynthesis glycosyltransferase
MTMLFPEIAVPVAPARPAEAANRRGLYRNGGKRVLDVVLVLVAMPVVLPVIAVLAILIAATGGRPFFRQARIGRGGRVYRIWKLRTMVPDAEARLAAHLAADPAAAAEWARTQKLRRDPRVTPLGRILRRTSLDELPQLFNVLRGDMSLIGPRPMMVDQAPLYPGRAYYALRPGISGPWQVSERNATSFADRARFDDRYDRDLSLLTDLRLILATFRAVVRGTGC